MGALFHGVAVDLGVVPHAAKLRLKARTSKTMAPLKVLISITSLL
jgi:hypothetical protein